MNFDLAKELHFRELDRRSQLDNAVTFRVAVLTGLGGLFSYFGRSYKLLDGGAALGLIILLSLGALTIVAAILILVRCYVGYEWQYLAYPSELLASYESLCAYHEEHGLDPEPGEAFEEQVRDRFVEAATFNMTQNNQRFEYLDMASKLIAASVVVAVLAGLAVIVLLLRAGA